MCVSNLSEESNSTEKRKSYMNNASRYFGVHIILNSSNGVYGGGLQKLFINGETEIL